MGTASDLDQLIHRRRSLTVDLAVHEASLKRFWPSDERPSFVIDRAELAGLEADDGGKPLHLTSTASCFESLADREPRFAGRLGASDAMLRGLAEQFARRALDTRPAQWMSDEAAHVYCRVRTLPAVIRFAPKLTGALASQRAARDRLIEAFAVIEKDRPPTDRGLGERKLDKAGRPVVDARGELYPANAFHAYWGSKANAEYEARRAKRNDLPALPANHLRRVADNHAWAQSALTRQSALLLAGKHRGDAQQLVFSLLTDLLANRGQLTPAGERFDLYDSALRAFFDAQEPSGRWPQSAPLFHYPQSGNAYCYTFETLTELLRPALPREEGRSLRRLLEPYLDRLFKAWDYAMETRVPLDEVRGDTYGWSSHHHVTRNRPEAWATAEVFAFGQLLRCVSGHVVAERAASELAARRPEYASRSEAEDELGSRGDTWASDGWTVGRQLAAMFLHPARMTRQDTDDEVRDPDAAVIGKNDARSAVLFGPPGTGKTTLVEALAGALGWQYVEILASDFLSAGIDAVPARADVIFDRLTQLDRCVVLFDEIDELIRDRTDDKSDPFGRFLTTSMLPKIAKLWKQRKLIFFVATNHVSKADPAITRSSRFDASIFVPPPGLRVKQELLAAELKGKAPTLDGERINRALAANHTEVNGLTHDELALAVIPLLRYDQMAELSRRLRMSRGGALSERLAKALRQMGDALLEHEWQPAKKDQDWQSKDTVTRLRSVYQEYVDDERSDSSRSRVVAAHASVADLVPRQWGKLARDGSVIYYRGPNELPLADRVAGKGVADRGVALERGARRAVDRGILSFELDT